MPQYNSMGASVCLGISSRHPGESQNVSKLKQCVSLEGQAVFHCFKLKRNKRAHTCLWLTALYLQLVFDTETSLECVKLTHSINTLLRERDGYMKLLCETHRNLTGVNVALCF